MVNEGLKKYIDTMADMLLDTARRSGHSEDIDQKTFKIDMATFAMYLSSSDGEIKWEEAKMIDDLFGIGFVTPEILKDFIVKQNIYSSEYETTPPLALKMMVNADNLLYSRGINVDTYGHELVLKAYRGIANEIINADNDADSNEESDAMIYLSMMENYIKNNFDGYKNNGNSAKITKNFGTVSAPVKNGVSAPRKS